MSSSSGSDLVSRCCLCFHLHPLSSLRDTSAAENVGSTYPSGLLLDKLRRFLGLKVLDGLRHVCLECIAGLDFCLGFVSRARRIEKRLLEGTEDEVVMSELEFWYPNLSGSLNISTESSPLDPEGIKGTATSAGNPHGGGGSVHTEESFQFDALTPDEFLRPEEETVRLRQRGREKAEPEVNFIVEVEPNDIFGESGGSTNSFLPSKRKQQHNLGEQILPRKTESQKLVRRNSLGANSSSSSDASEIRVVGKTRVRKILPKTNNSNTGDLYPAVPLTGAQLAPSMPMGHFQVAQSSGVSTVSSTMQQQTLSTIDFPQQQQQQQQQQVMIPISVKTHCKICNQLVIASSVQELKSHVCQDKDKTEACPESGCDKSFFSRNALKYHIKHNHSGKLPLHHILYSSSSPRRGRQSSSGASSGALKKYVCPEPGCSKSYGALCYLTDHKRLHTGERPFSCSECGKKFYRILDMKKHKLLKVCL